MLSGLDISIIIEYFILVTLAGLYFSKKAAHSMDDYFLGARSIPWFLLGISGMATYLDMSGTMLQSSFFYMLGAKGYWVAYRGAVALSLAFLMIFIAKWMNRSKVMTNAEWMVFRFGTGKGGESARLLAAVSTVIMAICFMAYFFIGSGKFLSMYFPFLTPNVAAVIFFGIVMLYTVASGFYGVVYTDLLQSILIIAVIGFVTVKALAIGTPEYFEEFSSPQWRQLIPTSLEMEMPQGYENMKFLALLVLFWIVANVFQGFAQPFDAWTSQRYYAARDERESSLVACQWILLFSLRFLLMMGVGVLAIGISSKIAEPEMALNSVIEAYFPIGLKGVFIAALIAAAMSTLDSTVNSSAAYFVKDIYKAHICPKASNSHLIKVSYLATAGFMVLGVVLGWNIPNINSIWAWIVMGLITGMLAPNIFKWFWWRFNGIGYAAGMASGLVSAIIHRMAFGDAPEYMTFLFVIAFSTAGTVIGTFLGKPTEMETLVRFYKQTKPFGFWGPVRKFCDNVDIDQIRKENRRDLLLLLPACIWQVVLFWVMTALIIKKWTSFSVNLALFMVLSFVLYKYWYRNLKASNTVKGKE